MDARSPIALAAVLENTSDLTKQAGFDAALGRSGRIASLLIMEPAARYCNAKAPVWPGKVINQSDLRSGSIRAVSITGLKSFVHGFEYYSSFRCRVLQA